ncbi:MAG: radical SAM protein [Elusimicrobia bacterium]|nr:radical SAM protein [Elusimicrobiota bacterium]
MALLHLFARCCQKCVFCSYPREKESGPAEEEKLSYWLKSAACVKDPLIQISGGEPFLAEPSDLLKLAAFCARLGRRVEIQTNASGVFSGFSEAELQKLIKTISGNGGYFNVNFSADTPAADFKITRTRGAFARRLKAVKKMLSLGAGVRLTFVVTRLNYPRLEKFAFFVVKELKGVSWVQFSFVKGVGRAALAKKIVPRYAAAAPYLRRALAVCGAAGLKCEVDHIPPCFLGKYHASHVDALKMKARSGGPHLAEKMKLPECRGCGFYGICSGPRKDYIDIYGGLK